MLKNIIGLFIFIQAFTVIAQTKPGQFASLAKYAGSWAIESIYEEQSLTLLLTKDFRINLDKFRVTKEDAFSQIDVIKGNMLLMSSYKDDPCLSSTFMSISLTDDNTVYLLAMRDRKIRIFHATFGQVTKDMKGHKDSKEVAINLKKMINQCKVKGIQNT
jgi:hypothetical protein